MLVHGLSTKRSTMVLININRFQYFGFQTIRMKQMMREKVAESGIEISRICNLMKCTKDDIGKCTCPMIWIQKYF